jgi:hypothetical protein
VAEPGACGTPSTAQIGSGSRMVIITQTFSWGTRTLRLGRPLLMRSGRRTTRRRGQVRRRAHPTRPPPIDTALPAAVPAGRLAPPIGDRQGLYTQGLRQLGYFSVVGGMLHPVHEDAAAVCAGQRDRQRFCAECA